MLNENVFKLALTVNRIACCELLRISTCGEMYVLPVEMRLNC